MIALIIVIVLIAILGIVIYNGLNAKKNRIEAAELELKKYLESGNEKDIDNAKKYYNAVVKEYNNAVESFPSSLVANMFNFPKMHSEGFDEGL